MGKQLRKAMACIRTLETRLPRATPLTPNPYNRPRGKLLSNDDRRAIHYGYHYFKENGYIDPMQQASVCMGFGKSMVNNVLKREQTNHKRGKYQHGLRQRATTNRLANDLRAITRDMNVKGQAVTLARIMKWLRNIYEGQEDYVPGRETIRKAMNSLGMNYAHYSKAKRNFIDIAEIKEQRKVFIKQRYSKKLENHLFIWQDESYCHRHHVCQFTWLDKKSRCH